MTSAGTKNHQHGAVGLRPANETDLELLFQVYAGTRWEELAVTSWGEEEKERFLRMQFDLQHVYYRQNYPDATFEVILVDGVPAGRLYREERDGDIRIMDIALLPAFRGRGTGSRIMADIIRDADNRDVSLSLHVECNNPVLDYYGRLGFEVCEERGVYLFMTRPPGGPRSRDDSTAGGTTCRKC
jgi:ribosomal protein S18 acetylase RimI-like enzyme